MPFCGGGMRPPPCCAPATQSQRLVFFAGIYLCAIGTGGAKAGGGSVRRRQRQERGGAGDEGVLLQLVLRGGQPGRAHLGDPAGLGRGECQLGAWVRRLRGVDGGGLKTLLRLVPIWLTSAVYFVANSQTQTTFVQQGTMMDTRIRIAGGAFSVPTASMTSVMTVSVVVYNRAAAPLMGLGHGAVVAAFAEVRRLASARAGHRVAAAAVRGDGRIRRVGQLEFFYDQAPETMRAASTAFYFLSLSVGSLLSSQGSVGGRAGGRGGSRRTWTRGTWITTSCLLLESLRSFLFTSPRIILQG